MRKQEDRISAKNVLTLHLRMAAIITKTSPELFPLHVLYGLVAAISPYVTVWLSARVITELSEARRPEMLWRLAIWTVLGTALLTLLKGALYRWMDVRTDMFYLKKHGLYTQKLLDLDFADMDNGKVYDLFTQVRQNENWSNYGIGYVISVFDKLCGGLFGIIGAAALTYSLFTTHVRSVELGCWIIH